MSERDFYDFLLEVTGDVHGLSKFSARHLNRGAFSFNSIKPRPRDLDYEMSNFVTDGYDALFGNWMDLTGRWMFKEAAAERGFPFPLQSREQVLECISALGEYGEIRLNLGQKFKRNLDLYGAGHATDWMCLNWDCESDVGETVALVEEQRVSISAESYGAPSKKMLSELSALHPQLLMTVVSLNEWGKRANQFALVNGNLKRLPKIESEEARQRVWGFRQAHGLAWMREFGYPEPLLGQIEMNERGRPMFVSSKVSLRLAESCLKGGESVESFAARFPAMNPAQVMCLRQLQGQSTGPR